MLSSDMIIWCFIDIKKTVDDVTDKIQPMIDQAESFKSSVSLNL